MPTKIKFILSLIGFFSIFLFAKLNYPAVIKEKNYFIELGHELDFSNRNNYAIKVAVNIPWLISQSSFSYSYFNNTLIPYHYFSTYHNFTYQGLRFYTDYNFHYIPRFEQTTNHKLINGFNFFWQYFLLSLELRLDFLENLAWSNHYSLAFFIKDDNHFGVNLNQKQGHLYIRSFINLALNDFFIRLEYDFSSYEIIFSLNFFHDFFRLRSKLTDQPLTSTRFANSIYFIPHNSPTLTPW